MTTFQLVHDRARAKRMAVLARRIEWERIEDERLRREVEEADKALLEDERSLRQRLRGSFCAPGCPETGLAQKMALGDVEAQMSRNEENGHDFSSDTTNR